jgi:hypothetical protein
MRRRRTTRDVRYRCAVRRFLNRPGWHGRATIIAEVEDTSRLHSDELRYDDRPRVHLSITDCSNECSFEFDLADRRDQANSLYKVDTMIRTLERFRKALQTEINLRNERARQSKEEK